MVLGVFGSAVALNSLMSLQTYLGQMLGQRVLFDLRTDVYRHLQSLEVGRHAELLTRDGAYRQLIEAQFATHSERLASAVA